MRTTIKLEELYKELYTDCPPEVWDDFASKINSEKEKHYQTLSQEVIDNIMKVAESKGNVKEGYSYVDLAYDLLTGFSYSKIATFKGISRDKVKKFMIEAEIPESSDEIKKRLKHLPGGATQQKNSANRIKNIDVDKLNEEYNNGVNIMELGKKYKVEPEKLKPLLKNLREADQNKRKNTIEILQQKPNEFYIKLFESNPAWSLTDLEKHIISIHKEPLSPKSVRYFIKSIGLESTEERQNSSRSIKSKGDKNTSYMIKKRCIEAIENSSYGSVDNLTKAFCTHKEGSYNMIASKINKELSINYVTGRQLSKLITKNKNYVKRQSQSELIFIESLKNALQLEEKDIIRQYQLDKGSQVSLDVYIPSLNMAFEFNGDYWHSDVMIIFNYGITAKEHHQRKIDKCKKNNIDLLYIWESDFDDKSEEIIELITQRKFNDPIFHKLENFTKRSYNSTPKTKKLKNIFNTLGINPVNHKGIYDCGGLYVREYTTRENNYKQYHRFEDEGKELFTIYPWYDDQKTIDYLSHRIKKDSKKVFARKCVIDVSSSLTKDDRTFIKDNHILGSPQFRKVVLVSRLLFEDNIVGMAIFIETKDKETVELKRLAFDQAVNVAGGASKLIKNSEKELSKLGYNAIMTFSDNDLGGGNVYKTIGFVLTNESHGDKIWFNPETGQHFSNKSLYMVGADRLLAKLPGYTPYGIGDNLPSNAEIVKEWGFIPITDSGYKTWVKGF